MANRVFIPTEPSNKRFWLEEIIRNLADKYPDPNKYFFGYMGIM